MAEQIRSNRQRELFIKKSTRIAASYLNRAKELSEMPDAAKPFFDVLENTFVKLQSIPSCAESSAKVRKHPSGIPLCAKNMRGIKERM